MKDHGEHVEILKDGRVKREKSEYEIKNGAPSQLLILLMWKTGLPDKFV